MWLYVVVVVINYCHSVKGCMKKLRRSFGKPEQQTPLKTLLAEFSMEVTAPPLLIREWVGSCVLASHSSHSSPLSPYHSHCSPPSPYHSHCSPPTPPLPSLSSSHSSPLLFLSTANAPRMYSNYMNEMSHFLKPILQCVMLVGQTQLIRRQVCRELGSASKYDSKLLFNTLQAFNQ